MHVDKERRDRGPVTTGNAEDDARLARLHANGGPYVPRRWTHLMFFEDRAGAEAAAAALEPAWESEVQATSDASGWQVLATQTGVGVTATSVTEARAWFTAYAVERGGVYDGWQAWS